MESIYTGCAVVGGTVLLLQFVLSALGLFDHDVDGADAVDDVAVEHDPSGAFFKLLSFKAIVAFLTFFGLTGMAAGRSELADPLRLLIAIGAGCLAFLLVAWLMAGMAKLQCRGNVDLRNALGATARVYLRVPGDNRGRGKVTVSVQGRTVEAKAFTLGDELPTGSLAQIVSVPSSDTVEVVAAAE